MCTVLKLARSSFYRWKAIQVRLVARTCADGLLGARIAAVFEDEGGLYGVNASVLHSTTMSVLRGSIIKRLPGS